MVHVRPGEWRAAQNAAQVRFGLRVVCLLFDRKPLMYTWEQLRSHPEEEHSNLLVERCFLNEALVLQDCIYTPHF